jgi:hypothetical protein
MTKGSHENEGPWTEPDKRGEELVAQRVAELAKLFESEEPHDPDGVSGPLHWPDLTAVEAGREWDELRTWVESLRDRFPHLDHHVIPLCWFRHNGHVEALVALRDHERVAFGESAPGTAAVDWHRAFRDIEARLREWTGLLACGAIHETQSARQRLDDADEWDTWVSEDVRGRQRQAVNQALVE